MYYFFFVPKELHSEFCSSESITTISFVFFLNSISKLPQELRSTYANTWSSNDQRYPKASCMCISIQKWWADLRAAGEGGKIKKKKKKETLCVHCIHYQLVWNSAAWGRCWFHLQVYFTRTCSCSFIDCFFPSLAGCRADTHALQGHGEEGWLEKIAFLILEEASGKYKNLRMALSWLHSRLLICELTVSQQAHKSFRSMALLQIYLKKKKKERRINKNHLTQLHLSTFRTYAAFKTELVNCKLREGRDDVNRCWGGGKTRETRNCVLMPRPHHWRSENHKFTCWHF